MAIRFAVFVTEQGYDADVEVDDKDAGSDHLLGQLDGRDVAVVRLFPPLAKLGRLAVVSSSRGTGAGKLMMEALEEHVKSGKGNMGQWRRELARTGSLPAEEERGSVKIQANVQKHAERFYSKRGYVAEGEDFLEVSGLDWPEGRGELRLLRFCAGGTAACQDDQGGQG